VKNREYPRQDSNLQPSAPEVTGSHGEKATESDFQENRLGRETARLSRLHTVTHFTELRSVFQAFCNPFWRDRSSEFLNGRNEQSDLFVRLAQACRSRARRRANRHIPDTAQRENAQLQSGQLGNLLRARVTLAPEMHVVEVACVIDDRVAPRQAIDHPELEQPVAFLGGHEIVPLLEALPGARRLEDLLAVWSSRIPVRTAIHIASWLRQRRILELHGNE
jgi:hypothetical protein